MVTKVEKSAETWILFNAVPVGKKVCRASPLPTSHHWRERGRERERETLDSAHLHLNCNSGQRRKETERSAAMETMMDLFY
ncbi:hypothetical protein EYF80_053062 [Liparis tanakae]|uniref:Uncharacterized protein n=1 Tax=Liparis tanakae TaxID=230148 RepID=A0A4Z2F6U4_9TELE|nr:hypothetical protein EYF80_053062 [Liparis tanakae]